MDTTFLLNHAQQKIWSSPYQDLQAVIKPHRLSDSLGAKQSFALAWLNIVLPSNDSRYHIYQLGRLHPALVGMLPVRETWTSASAQMNVQGMIIDVYTAKGLKLPLFDTFFKVLSNDNLIIAVRDQGFWMDVPAETLFVRFYSNAFFESPASKNIPPLPDKFYVKPIPSHWTFPDDIRSNVFPGNILTQGIRVKTRDELMVLDQRVAQLRALGYGGVVCTYNGEWVPDFSGYYYNSSRIKSGDWAEFVFDASIRKIQSFDIKNLKTFLSIKDTVNKYLLMCDDPWTGEVLYKDDFDFYLQKTEGGRKRGRYYYRNVPQSVRMVTHQDYSLPVHFVNGYVDQASDFVDPMSWTIMMVYRHSGYTSKKLLNEHSRLNEFFKLPIELRERAFQGIDSTIPWWRADYLENSDLAVLFGERPFSFTSKQVEDALGYYAVSNLINPCLIETNLASDGVTWHATLPMGLQGYSTIFEYDKDGVLLNYRQTIGTVYYVCDNPLCRYIEGVAGSGSRYQGTFFGAGPHQLDMDWDYGFYKRAKVGGVAQGTWLVADAKDFTIDAQNKAWWNISPANWQLAIRSNKDFLLYEVDVDARDGLTILNVQAIEADPLEPDNHIEDLPFGQLDLYFNRRALIRGLDYTGEWPMFVITNTEFIKEGGLQSLLVRATGLADNVDGVPTDRKSTEVGFVRYGKLSRNRRYNARTGKVQRYVVRGKVMPRSKLNFSEDSGVPNASPVVNGDPYVIDDVVVPVGNFTKDDSYKLRALETARDKPIEDYMSKFFDDEPQPNPNPIPQRYQVVSPFMTKIIHDMKYGLLPIGKDILPMTQTKMEVILKDYMYLLPYDPIIIGFDWDSVVTIPHADPGVITLGVYEYHVLATANRILFFDMLDLSKYLYVDPAWTPQALPPLQ